MKTKTQAECRQEFLEALKLFIGQTKIIDAQTPASPDFPYNEPEWWVEMMALQRAAIDAGRKLAAGGEV